MTSTHVQPELGQEDMSREFSLSFANIVKYMQVSDAPNEGCHCTRRPGSRSVSLPRVRIRAFGLPFGSPKH
jgi:hypothetical protein